MLETEPRDLLLDADNDLVIGSDLSFSSGLAGVVQSCRIALQMFRGEWFLDLDAGIPYWDQILGQRADVAIAIARDEYRRELLEVEDVLAVLKLEVSFENSTRTLRIRWQVDTEFGETPVEIIDVGVPA